MGLFEFLMVLVSIIVGLGVAEVLTGVARTIRRRGSVDLYWVHGILVLSLFVALLQQWWEAWGLRDVSEWSFLALLLLMAAPVCLFLMAHLVFPEPVEDTKLEDYYYGEMRPIWILGAVAVTASTLFRPIIFGSTLFSASNATSFLALVAFAFLYRSSRRSLHGLLMPIFLLLLLADILWWSRVIGA